MDDDHSGGIQPDRRHHTRVTFLLSSSDPTTRDDDLDLVQLEQDLESPSVIYFDDGDCDNDNPHQTRRYNSCYFLWWKCKQFKMLCGCGHLCLFLLFITLLILTIVIPVHLQETQPLGHRHNSYDDDIMQHNGYSNPEDGNPQEQDHRSGNHNAGGAEDYAESVHVQPPLLIDHDDVDGDANTTPTGNKDDDILVVRHDDVESVIHFFCSNSSQAGSSPHPSSATTGDENKDDAPDAITFESAPNVQKECNHPPETNPLDSKLESIISAISNIHQSIEKMETLMQGTLMDDQRGKCISAIHSGNGSLALKHWAQILKYQPTPEGQSSSLSLLVKEAYNGVTGHILPVANFIKDTTLCSGFSTLYSEMINYGHVFGGHPYIFPVTLKIQQSCSHDTDITSLVPPTVTSMLQGSFTLQNKANKGYFYYAKRCISRHYYHCLDVLTKRLPQDGFDALEEESDEWRRYRWRINSTQENTSTFFFILNEDKYSPYRLQDLNNSPRFKMEEASSTFEVDMGYFQFGLETEDQVVIEIKDSNIFLEGEDFKLDNEILLNSYHKTGNTTANSDRIRWIVRRSNGAESGGGEGKLRHARSSAVSAVAVSQIQPKRLKFPLWKKDLGLN